ncbi:MAG: HalOD1 output domain-containing protein [Haloferacaceae archaeon]
MSDCPTDDAPESGDLAYRDRFDWEEIEPSVAVVDVLSEVTGERPKNVGPLAAYLDPDSLNSLLQPNEPTPTPVSVAFRYCDHRVVAHGDGRLLVRTVDR